MFAQILQISFKGVPNCSNLFVKYYKIVSSYCPYDITYVPKVFGEINQMKALNNYQE